MSRKVRFSLLSNNDKQQWRKLEGEEMVKGVRLRVFAENQIRDLFISWGERHAYAAEDLPLNATHHSLLRCMYTYVASD